MKDLYFLLLALSDMGHLGECIWNFCQNYIEGGCHSDGQLLMLSLWYGIVPPKIQPFGSRLITSYFFCPGETNSTLLLELTKKLGMVCFPCVKWLHKHDHTNVCFINTEYCTILPHINEHILCQKMCINRYKTMGSAGLTPSPRSSNLMKWWKRLLKVGFVLWDMKYISVLKAYNIRPTGDLKKDSGMRSKAEIAFQNHM